ncbi:hypothetical protein [Lysobacter sp. D1-1-M9]|uniref:hypothetical protein n=1 Tax=Novilysobacter longmucuonensis TaxID=3098603 RepID=UPI002FCC6015
MSRIALLLPSLLLAIATGPAWAQDTTVLQVENVRFDYAQVLRVSPVYQTLTATRMEEQCDQSPRPRSEDDSRLSRVVGVVREALSRDGQPLEESVANCRSVPVERQFRRPIAYDVDYVYKGGKYRSRLPEDPGNRLRIRVAITPAVAGARAPLGTTD